MDTAQLTEAIDAAVVRLEQGDVKSDTERQKLLAAARRLQGAAEGPIESVASVSFDGFRETAVLTAVRMKLFDALAEAKDGQITVEELAKKTNAEVAFTTRIMRFLVAMAYAKELKAGVYTPTKKTSYFVTGSMMIDALLHFSVPSLVLKMFPDYCVKYGFKNPDDYYDGPFQYAMKRLNHPDAGSYWDFLKNDPEQLEAFNRVMILTRGIRDIKWYDIFPCEERFKDTKPDEVLLVDIGGGEGNDLAAFHTRFPNQPGQLVLQDLPQVIKDIKDLAPAIQRSEHDFFAPQPIKGARAYFMCNVLHDWPNKQALQILKHVRDAMSPESVLLVNESVMPDQEVSLFSASADFNMMSCFSALERTWDQWNTLLETAGLRLVKTWKPENDVVLRNAVFEAVRKD